MVASCKVTFGIIVEEHYYDPKEVLVGEWYYS
jgi:hypothetical protein